MGDIAFACAPNVSQELARWRSFNKRPIEIAAELWLPGDHLARSIVADAEMRLECAQGCHRVRPGGRWFVAGWHGAVATLRKVAAERRVDVLEPADVLARLRHIARRMAGV